MEHQKRQYRRHRVALTAIESLMVAVAANEQTKRDQAMTPEEVTRLVVKELQKTGFLNASRIDLGA